MNYVKIKAGYITVNLTLATYTIVMLNYKYVREGYYMKNIFRTVAGGTLMSKLAFGVASLGLVGLIGFGTAAAQTGNTSISGTGYGSNNTVTITDTNSTTVTNTNNVNVSNTTNQTSTSGSATISDNTSGGAATTGNTSNTSSSSFNVTINNN